MENEAVFFTNLKTLLHNDDQDGSYWKTFLDSSVAKQGQISESSLSRWMNSGMVWRGEYWMRNFSEHPNAVAESSLSQAINLEVPLKYFLITNELQSLLKRAESRKKSLPMDLETAIKGQISTLSKMPLLEECILLARRGKDIEAMVKLGLLIQGEEVTLSVRRLTPLEYERLQGFPVDWTLVDTKV